MFAKLIDGVLYEAPRSFSKDGKVIYNPSKEKYEAEGYMEVVDTPYPEIQEGEEPKYYTFDYEEEDNKIVKVWIETGPPITPEPKPTVEDRLVKLESELNNTNANLNTTMEAVDYLLVGEMEGMTDDTILGNEN